MVAEVERRLSVAQEVEGIIADGLRRAERLRQSMLKQAFTGGVAIQTLRRRRPTRTAAGAPTLTSS